MGQYKIIALIGEAGSGKDTILNKVVQKNPNLHKIVNYTTRPPREGEKNGINYHFVDEETFANKVVKGEMLEMSFFNDWLYGTGIKSLNPNRINIGVFSPVGIESAINNTDDQIEIYVYRIIVSPKTRLLRQLNREKNPDVDEIIRRYHTDQVDFEKIEINYNIILNETEEDLVQSIAVLGEAARRLEAKFK